MIYNEQYYKSYIKYSGTEEEEALMNFRIHEVLKKALDSLSSGPKHILDLGCAAGAFLYKAQLSEQVADNNFTGVDINPYCVAHCTSIGVKAFVPAMFDYFYKDKEIDIMTFWDAFEHLQDPRKLLSEYKPKVICISLPCLDGFHEAMPFTDIQLWKHYRPQEHLWNFTLETLTRFLSEANYNIVHVTYKESEFRVDKVLGDKNIMTVIAEKRIHNNDCEKQ